MGSFISWNGVCRDNHKVQFVADIPAIWPSIQYWHLINSYSIQFNSNSYLMQPEYGDLAMQAFVERRGT
jgi:hypothetical protein